VDWIGIEYDKKWDTAGLEKDEKEINGFLDGSEFDQVVYSTTMTLGSILLIMAYISTFYNERKYLNLSRFQAIVKE